MTNIDILIIGGGPAGLAAAVGAYEARVPADRRNEPAAQQKC